MTAQTLNEKTAGIRAFFGSGERQNDPDHSGLKALYRKELADHLNSKRFYLIFTLLFLTATASLAGAVSNLSGAVSESSEFIFLKLFTTGGSSI